MLAEATGAFNFAAGVVFFRRLRVQFPEALCVTRLLRRRDAGSSRLLLHLRKQGRAWMKNKYWLLALALILPLTFAGAHPMQRSAQSLDEGEARKRIANDFAEALLLAQEKSASTVDYDRAAKASINGMLRTLDPHSMYFDAKQWEEFQNDQRSRYYGIGSAIVQRNGKVYIWSPTEGTASYRAGLRFGDHIVEINGESTADWNQTQVRNKLIGPEGTQVTVKVARLGVEKPLEFKLTRGAVPL